MCCNKRFKEETCLCFILSYYLANRSKYFEAHLTVSSTEVDPKELRMANTFLYEKYKMANIDRLSSDKPRKSCFCKLE